MVGKSNDEKVGQFLSLEKPPGVSHKPFRQNIFNAVSLCRGTRLSVVFECRVSWGVKKVFFPLREASKFTCDFKMEILPGIPSVGL